MKYVEVQTNLYGQALFTTKQVPINTVVEKFIGPEVSYQDLSDHDKRYALTIESSDKKWIWMLATTDAIFANRLLILMFRFVRPQLHC